MHFINSFHFLFHRPYITLYLYPTEYLVREEGLEARQAIARQPLRSKEGQSPYHMGALVLLGGILGVKWADMGRFPLTLENVECRENSGIFFHA